MPRTFEFHSTGKAIGDALDEFLVQRELRKQQIIENQLRQAQEARTQAQEGRLNRQLALSEETQRGAAEDRRQAAKDREAERAFRRATTIATVGVPGTISDPQGRELEEQGYGTLVKRTPPGREFAAQDPTTGQDVFYETPGIVSFTGGTQWQAREDTQQARADAARLANEAKVEAAKAAAMERADRAAERQMFQESQNALNRQIQQGNLDIRREAADREAKRREGGRPVLSSDAARITELDTSLDDVTVLRDTIATTPGATGTGAKLGTMVPNWVTEATGLGAESKGRQAVIDRVKQVIGKALEGGVLRKEDEAKYTKILPTIGDPQSIVEVKLRGLEQAILSKRQRTLENLADAGYNISNYPAERPRSPGQAPTTPGRTIGRFQIVE